jgi:putative transcriptional regulator
MPTTHVCASPTMTKKPTNQLLDGVRHGPVAVPGEGEPTRTYIGDPDVRRIREQYGMSQERFARLMGIGVATLRSWEEGRRKPELAARVLLRVATAVDPRVLVATWLATGLILWFVVGPIAYHDKYENIYPLISLPFAIISGLVYTVGIYVFRNVAAKAILGFYCGLTAATIFIRLESIPKKGSDVLVLLAAGATAGTLCTSLRRRVAHRR